MNPVNILLIPMNILIVVSNLTPVFADRSVYACEGNNLNINCAEGVINVIRSNYGRLSTTICNTNGNAPIRTTNCVSRSSSNLVNDKCQNRQSCSIRASNNVFGDPCDGTLKYLEVQYQCTKPNENAVACEGSSLEIECERGEVISVQFSNYGRRSPNICNDGGNAPIRTNNCLDHHSKRIVNKYCEGKRRCSIPANNNLFQDPCEGTFKYLEVDYTCIRRFN